VRRRAIVAACGLLLLLSGCTIPGLGASAGGKPSSTSTTGPWKTVQISGPPRPSPGPVPYTSPSPTGLLTFPARTLPPTSAVCSSPRGHGVDMPMDVAVSGGTATVTWWHNGDSRIVEYRVTAVLQATTSGDQKPLTWTSVAPGTGCNKLTTTLTGLASGSTYEIWVDTLATSTEHPGLPEDLMAGRSTITVP
jgi:hypothetical protein